MEIGCYGLGRRARSKLYHERQYIFRLFGKSIRGARVSRVPRTSHAALAAPRRSIPVQEVCGAGSTRVHTGPIRSGRVYMKKSCSLASCTTQLFVWRGSTRVWRREAVLFAWRQGHQTWGHTGPSGRGGPIVWRGSTRVLEEARERF